MIDFGPFKLGQALSRGEDGFEHFATLDGKPVAVWKYPGSVADLPASSARTVDVQRPLGQSSWVRLERSGVQDGAPWVSGELVRGLQLGRLLYSRRWEKSGAGSEPLPVPRPIAVGLALTFARALKDRATLALEEREFRATGIHTCQWRMRIDLEGGLRPMFEPAMYCAMPPIGQPSDFDLISPELVRPGQLAHRAQSDVFQLAAFAGLLLRGDGLFGSDPQQIVETVTAPEPVPLELLLPTVEPELRAILAAAMVRDPTRRTATVAELAAQLERFGDEEEARQWVRSETVRLHAEDLKHQERAFGELEGRVAEPIPPELEERVMAARRDETAWLVLADWLNANGYPRGELAIRHHRDRGPKPVRHEDLTDRERKELIAIDRFYWLYDLDLYFHYGYVDAVVHVEASTRAIRRRRTLGVDVGPEFQVPRFPDSVERNLFQALSLPTFRFLRAVLIDSNCAELDAVVRALAASGHKGVEEIFVPHERVPDVSEALRPRLPRLKRVRSCTECSEEQRRALLGYG